jgi:hypothetical protein
MERSLKRNQRRTNLKFWERVLALVHNILRLPLARTASVPAHKFPPVSLHGSTAGVRERKGQFHYIIKGRRSYLTLELQNRSNDRVIVGLGEGRNEVWVRKVKVRKGAMKVPRRALLAAGSGGTKTHIGL